MPEKVSGPCRVGVRRIFPPVLDGMHQKRAPRRARNLEEGPHECHTVAELPCPSHACESGEAGSSQDSVKNGFCLVIRRMGHQHVPRTNLAGDLGKKRVSQPASPGFEPLAGRLVTSLPHGQRAPPEGHTEPPCEPVDELAVVVGLGSQIVLGMGDHQIRYPELLETDEHRHTVSPTRNGNYQREPAGA